MSALASPLPPPLSAGPQEELISSLNAMVGLLGRPRATIEKLRRLSGGASHEIWSFELNDGGDAEGLVLRRMPPGERPSNQSIGLNNEAALMRLAKSAGIPVPAIRHVLTPDDAAGEGFIMSHIEGEVIPTKILRDPVFAPARAAFTRQSGRILAAIHAIDIAELPFLPSRTPAQTIEWLDAAYRATANRRPVFELALRWLRDHVSVASSRVSLVHGDFRNGNLMIGPDGIRAVLDWEISHRGDPAEDLAWICINSWRFGRIDHAVGGLGSRADMLDAYEVAGGEHVTPERLHFWEVAGTLNWGVMCAGMPAWIRCGHDRSVERAAIARRASETEIDLLRLLLPRGTD